MTGLRLGLARLASAAILLSLVGCGKDDEPAGPGDGGLPLFVNEILASNGAVAVDPDFGEAGDWFEIYNGGSEAIDLDSFAVSDDPDEPGKWRFPEGTTIGAGGFLLVWADDGDTTIAAHHANFKLSAAGEEVGLYDEDLGVIDRVVFGAQDEDVSYGRVADGGTTFRAFETPTPGVSNGGPPANRPPAIVFVSALPSTPGPSDSVTVRAVITDADGVVASAALVWDDGGGAVSTELEASGDTFSAVIPARPVETRVDYYLTASDDVGAGARYPATGALAYTVTSAPSSLFINELLADNETVNTDPDFGEYGDWVELYNGGASPVDLGGWHLTDDFGTPDKWTFPAGVVIGSGEHLMVWTDDGDTEGAALHSNFKLSKDGEQVGLYGPSLAVADTITFGVQTEDVSYGRIVDGGGAWGFLDPPTPGAPNDGKETGGKRWRDAR